MKYLITFGAGKKNYIDAGKRLIKQANNTNYFDKTILFTDKELKEDKIFWKQHFFENYVSQVKNGPYL